jgi:hypothetical protein
MNQSKIKLTVLISIMAVFSIAFISVSLAFITTEIKKNIHYVVHDTIDATISCYHDNHSDVLTYDENGILEISLNDLVYVDFDEDIIQDKTDSLDDLATSYTYTITSNSDLDFYTKVSYQKQDGTRNEYPELVVLILTGSEVTRTDYYTYLQTVMNESTNTNKRQVIHDHNVEKLTDLFNDVCGKNETRSFKIVFWGDYNQLTEEQQTNYDHLEFPIRIQISLIQALYHGEAQYEDD